MFLHDSPDKFPVNISVRCQWALRRAGLAWLCLAGSGCLGQDVHPAVTPPSKWVSPLTFDKRAALLGAAPAPAEWRWLLVERQFNPQTDEQFSHYVGQVPAPADGPNAPPIAIHYDPGCQVLALHWVRLWRGTNLLNRLDPSKVQFSRRAPLADGFLFGADRTAVITLDEARPGDILDYAYTVEGSNPALDGKFVGMAPAQLPEAVERLVTKVRWPRARKLYVQNHGASLTPASLLRSNLVEYTWEFRNVPGGRLEGGTPPWYLPFPWVQLSEFQTWADVSQWALRWLKSTNALSAEVTNKIHQWKLLPDPPDRALAALRFVQEEIGNVGPADGVPSYEPVPPSGVVARRFGDAKEKTVLLVTLLQALQIEAFPVLVSTRWQSTLPEFHPSPTLFDHAIAAVILEGQTCWLDATAQYECGPLDRRSRPLYGFGLAVRPGAADLTPIPPCPVPPRTMVTAYFSLGSLHSESALRTVTVAEGADADHLRQHYATRRREDVDLENLNTCAKYYPQIHRTRPTLLRDDEQDDRIEITEFYGIEGLWSRPPNETEYHCRLYGVNVAEAMEEPPESPRAMPWALRYPVHQIFHAEAALLTSLPVNTGVQTIEHPDFYFRRAADLVDSKVVLDYEYRSLSDFVPPGALALCRRRWEAATATQGFTLLSFESP